MEKKPTYTLTPCAFSLPAPAKINHFLHIVGRRSDGYHLLQTLFQYLDYGDQLYFEWQAYPSITVKFKKETPHSHIPLETNLIYRAARLLQENLCVQQGVKIQIKKRLPIGAGLGGGSSNAASTLIALNYLWQLNLSLPELLKLGLILGADVPFFLHGHSAWGEGIGEKLTSVELKESWLIIITPACQVTTQKMYAHQDLTRDSTAFRIGSLTKEEVSTLVCNLRNDFEPLVRRCYREVDAVLQWLSHYGYAKLSGSGSSVFACFDSERQAQDALYNMPSSMKGFIAKSVNTSPLVSAVEKLGFSFDGWGVAKR